MNNSNKQPARGDHEQETRAIDIVRRGLARRRGAEQRFKIYGLGAVLVSLSFLALLFFTIFANGHSAFLQTFVQLEVFFDPDSMDTNDPANSNFPGLVKKSLSAEFPDVKGRKEKKLSVLGVLCGSTWSLNGNYYPY